MIIKPYQFQIGDVVTYKHGARGPFMDMMVVSEEEKGFNLLRPFIVLSENKAGFESLYWAKDSNMQFLLLRRV